MHLLGVIPSGSPGVDMGCVEMNIQQTPAYLSAQSVERCGVNSLLTHRKLAKLQLRQHVLNFLSLNILLQALGEVQ